MRRGEFAGSKGEPDQFRPQGRRLVRGSLQLDEEGFEAHERIGRIWIGTRFILLCVGLLNFVLLVFLLRRRFVVDDQLRGSGCPNQVATRSSASAMTRNWRVTTTQAILRACPTPRLSALLVAAFFAACRS